FGNGLETLFGFALECEDSRASTPSCGLEPFERSARRIDGRLKCLCPYLPNAYYNLLSGRRHNTSPSSIDFLPTFGRLLLMPDKRRSYLRIPNNGVRLCARCGSNDVCSGRYYCRSCESLKTKAGRDRAKDFSNRLKEE